MAKKIYLVLTPDGREHVFFDWPRCHAFVSGNPYRHAGGRSLDEARLKLALPRSRSADASATVNRPRRAGSARPEEGICSDGACSGNPGPSEWQVTDLCGVRLAHQAIGRHTNNYAELAGLLAAVRLAADTGERTVWTDSATVLHWVSTGWPGSSVAEREAICKMVDDVRSQLAANPGVALRKWDTRRWGEIPADFGRK